MFKRQPISFNLDCPHQKELYDWCKSNSANFSGFVKDVLFLYKQSQNSFSNEDELPRKVVEVIKSPEELNVISDMF
ncbi:hypothetical protein AWH56_005095 [Anaerobacillus isosaccharinicus]|uniref:Uncharacterized protein n=1 Tax=Anaerobacillus isosaccharinicus TaxID=1532552 RepID=A0A1S2LB82_9BACI|nr:hypothetical protein [Anaerobacillus isosaccharinicus]MBA5584597.1 hypothetical protein [Anaerobacillus isosaccharinicus]QOY37024.1 hypothetical protein AWH56_005095 [Anaerobacillus isosaccharinicus]